MMNNDDYDVLAERLGFPGSVRLCSILQILMTPEQAKLVVALPGSVAEVAAKTGVPEEEARQELDALYYKGIIFPRVSFDDRDYYRFARHLIQLHDSTLANPDLDPQRDRAFFRLWHEFSLEESFPLMAGLFKVATTRITRVIPYYNAIKDLPGVLSVEDFHAILRAQDLIAVVPWDCLTPRGANNADMSGVNTSCQCCRDCCEEYVAMDQAGVPVSVWWEKSRYQAYIPEADVCNACQACVDACQFDAIQMVDSEAGGGLTAAIDPEQCFGWRARV